MVRVNNKIRSLFIKILYLGSRLARASILGSETGQEFENHNTKKPNFVRERLSNIHGNTSNDHSVTYHSADFANQDTISIKADKVLSTNMLDLKSISAVGESSGYNAGKLNEITASFITV